MRNGMDFSPLFRSTIGFDRLFNLLDEASGFEPAEGYPPYNIVKSGEDSYRITMAVAGFSPDELNLTAQQNQLVVTGRKQDSDTVQYLHRGIATRAFQRRFDLADYVKVKGATLDNGLLTIELVREVPEEMKPRQIAINGSAKVHAIEAQPTGEQAKLAA